ncbi:MULTISPECIES: transposase [unclassified Paenibacillus]|uniref:transposase n=1 Tax=unclassified Paenibacillus TaxID=185978 RepID=UPI001C10BAAB|nr:MULTISPECIES: transposase [unclassified Paenibacillus]MBU5440596.1 transposase [Paenibacillus sp. MSJ-34]CAH0120062.1 hypothetical protein PAE9249_02575 [Paenibacillus sp. CECT 9249]
MMSLDAFMRQFGDDEACRSYLSELRWPSGFCCPRCDSNRHCYIESRHVHECLDCHAQISVTSGTVMHGTKLPLSYWMFTFCWIASGELCTARKLAATLQLNYRSASRMLRAVRMAMQHSNGFHPLSEAARKKPVRPQTEPVIEKAREISRRRALRFIRSVYRKVSPAYLQSYVDEYYFRFARNFYNKLALPVLVRAGLYLSFPGTQAYR